MSILNQHVNLDMPAAQYHAVDALSKSMMSKILKSPAHYRAALDEHQEPSKAMQMGTAIHTAVLPLFRRTSMDATKKAKRGRSSTRAASI